MITMNYLPDQFIIRFKAGVTPSTALQIISRVGGLTVIDTIPVLNVYVVSVDPALLNIKMTIISNFSGVEYVEYNGILNAQLTPNDPLFPQQWGLLKINSVRAWNVTRGSTLVNIAILDTGVQTNHPDLVDKIILSQNFSTSATSEDLNGHGTHVAGIAAATTRNDLGVAGLAINPKIMNIKVLDDSGSGSFSDVAQGVIYAADNGAKVINLSLGGPSASATLQNALQYAKNNGVLNVAAAGNDNSSNLFFPAAYAQCLSVAALNQDDTKAAFSNYGASWVDVAAPGVSILSTLPTYANSQGGTDYGSLSGTSMATPFVSGLAALMLSLDPNATNVQNAIETTTVPINGTGSLYQRGRINTYAALLNISQ
ncbi:peptidase S8 [Guptibacillus algicola]|uniref:peptidase S8 n=1 Tax=Guptibacillus algicola TaxID=225844 RepID=UPI001CD4CEED|nr:peptidase S8 [Alkalihalobacillus algicola]MCA0987007.1 S8 family serine peptidase [Alkalihalobacillus algicola]